MWSELEYIKAITSGSQASYKLQHATWAKTHDQQVRTSGISKYLKMRVARYTGLAMHDAEHKFATSGM